MQWWCLLLVLLVVCKLSASPACAFVSVSFSLSQQQQQQQQQKPCHHGRTSSEKLLADSVWMSRSIHDVHRRYSLIPGDRDDEDVNADQSTDKIFTAVVVDAADTNPDDANAITEEESEEEIIRLLRGPLGNTNDMATNINNKLPRSRTKAIFILSDSTAVTAKSMVEKSLTQFNGCDHRYVLPIPKQRSSSSTGGELYDDDDEDCELLQTKLFSYCRNKEQIANVIEKACQQHDTAMVVFTLADPIMRDHAARLCELEGLLYLDLFGPMLNVMTRFFDRPPMGTPLHETLLTRTSTPATTTANTGASSTASSAASQRRRQRRRRALSDSYYRTIEAVEFTLKTDDGMAPWLLPQADVILVGPSRTGKTPLSVVLSQTLGLKVANVPLVPEVPPPRQLIQSKNDNDDTDDDETIVDARRIFCLTLNPSDLQRIRKNRLVRELGHAPTTDPKGNNKVIGASNYADRAYLMRDLMNAKRLTDQYGWTEIDVTGRAVEETASLIGSILNERFATQD